MLTASPGEEQRSTADAEIQSLHPGRRARSAEPSRGESSLRELGWTALEHRWILLSVAAAVVATAAAYLLLAASVYRSSVLIHLDSRTRPVQAFGDLAELFHAEAPTEGEMHIMKSRPLVDAVADQLGLDIEAFPRTVPLVGRALRRDDLGAPAPAPTRFGLDRFAWGLDRFAWGGERIGVKQLVVSAALLAEPLRVTALEEGRYRLAARDGTVLLEGQVGTPATGGDGERSVRLLVSELVARPGTEFVVRKLRRIDVVEKLQDALEIREQGRNTGLVMIRLAGHDPARIAAILDAVSAHYVRQSTERASAEASKTLAFLDAQLPRLKANLEKAESVLNGFQRRNGAVDLPAMTQRLLDRVADTERAIAENDLRAAELAHRYAPDHPNVPLLAQRTQQLRVQLANANAAIRSLPDLELEHARLSRQLRVATELYMLVLNRAEELRIVRSGWVGNVRVLENAVVPYRPVGPKKGGVLTIAALVGLAAGFGAAFARKQLDDRTSDPDEIEAATGLSVVAAIPSSRAQRRLARRRRRGRLAVVSAGEAADVAVEELRSLRTSVQLMVDGARNNVIAVTGLAPRGGKSFVTVNLAHLLAAANQRVLLVDGDLRRGVLHRYFGMEAQPGLAEAVTGAAELDAVLKHTDTLHLDLLPAGRPPSNPAELLVGTRFQQILDEVGRRYQAVIVDTPPILSVTDSALVGRHAGVTLLVLRAGEHSLGEISFALRRLAQNGVTVRAAILNCIHPHHGRYGRGPYRRSYHARS
jgi:tyrosine-protein kinase Etk/Wzc